MGECVGGGGGRSHKVRPYSKRKERKKRRMRTRGKDVNSFSSHLLRKSSQVILQSSVAFIYATHPHVPYVAAQNNVFFLE